MILGLNKYDVMYMTKKEVEKKIELFSLGAFIKDNQYLFDTNKIKIQLLNSLEDEITYEWDYSYKSFIKFYKHFIICFGDYGSFIFNCSSDVVKNKKLVIDYDVGHLVEKLSMTCKKYDWNCDLALLNIRLYLLKYSKEIKSNFNNLLGEYDYEVEHLYDESSDKFMFQSDLCNGNINRFIAEDNYEIYDVGNVLDNQLAMNLTIINHILEAKK